MKAQASEATKGKKIAEGITVTPDEMLKTFTVTIERATTHAELLDVQKSVFSYVNRLETQAILLSAYFWQGVRRVWKSNKEKGIEDLSLADLGKKYGVGKSYLSQVFNHLDSETAIKDIAEGKRTLKGADRTAQAKTGRAANKRNPVYKVAQGHIDWLINTLTSEKVSAEDKRKIRQYAFSKGLDAQIDRRGGREEEQAHGEGQATAPEAFQAEHAEMKAKTQELVPA